MHNFRKRPVPVSARQFTASSMYDVLSWIRTQGGTATEAADALGPVLVIRTLEGSMAAHPGDWIVRGVRGEFHPVRGDIFAETYEPTDGQPAEAHPSATRWRLEYDNGGGSWLMLTSPVRDRNAALAELAQRQDSQPGWEFRIVRVTTTYAVEAPQPGQTPRPCTSDRVRTTEDGRKVATITMQRYCRAGHLLGDVTDAEVVAVAHGQPLPDVRAECPACSQAAAEAQPS